MSSQIKTVVISFAVVLILVLVISVSVVVTSTNKNVNSDIETIQQELFNNVEPESIKANLKYITSKPHIAGSTQDEVELVKFISDHFEKYTDKVETFSHKVKLSYTRMGPSDKSRPGNKVDIKTKAGAYIYQSTLYEKDKIEDGFDTANDGVTDLFLAFTPSGNQTGVPVYINYGSNTDFETLCQNAADQKVDLCESISPPKFNLKNYPNLICIMRYGAIFRGNKIQNAEKYGCQAALLYSDPQQYAPNGPDYKTYADGVYMPPEGGQRGSTMMIHICFEQYSRLFQK